MNRFLYRIDRMLSYGQGRQFLLIMLVVSGVVILFWGISMALGFRFSVDKIIQLVLSPGSFTHSDVPGLAFQIIVNLTGLVLVWSLLISLFSNIVQNRSEAFTQGLVRYRYQHHVLFLGADDMLADTITGQCAGHSSQPIVVLTEQDAAEVRTRLMAQLQDPSLRRRLVVLYGQRTQREQLLSVYAQRAERVFILGEPEEQDHDSKNILCLSLIKKLVTEADDNTVECYFLCHHLSTLRILQLQSSPLPKQLHLTVMNTSENWAQRVLVNGNGYPMLNRHANPSEQDADYVHLVLLGASQMAYSLASTCAHIAHYPNFFSRGVRTRITLVDPEMDTVSHYLRSRYDSLFRLARRAEIYWDQDGERKMHTTTYIPEADYDFLDIEWQFITARPETPELRTLLDQWSRDEQQMLTIAVCSDDMHANLATALYLPDHIATRGIPVLVYQSTNAALAEWTNDFTRYKNIYPFGMREDCYDVTFRSRLEWAKQGNEAYEDNAARLNPARKRKSWNDLKLTLHFSNLYSANYYHSVLCRIDPQYHARLEHQRWLTERLLLGYKAMDKAERVRIEQLPEEQKWKEMERLDPAFEHPNIQPFEELTAESVRKDEIMVQLWNNNTPTSHS